MSAYEVIVTASGARALRDVTNGEIMHPGAGPLIESQALYIGPSRLRERLDASQAHNLVLFDIGLGAGSNAIAAWHASEARAQAACKLEIVSFDHTLAALEEALRPEHARAFGFEDAASQAATQLVREHRCDTSRTRWRLRLGDIVAELRREPSTAADIVFWDPFSPRTDPALWSVAAFQALRRVCRDGATVHTYSGATSTRAALLLAGFAVGFGEPAGHKQKHSTIAATSLSHLERPLARAWLERYSQSRASWPADAPHDAIEKLSALPQFRGSG